MLGLVVVAFGFPGFVLGWWVGDFGTVGWVVYISWCISGFGLDSAFGGVGFCFGCFIACCC